MQRQGIREGILLELLDLLLIAITIVLAFYAIFGLVGTTFAVGHHKSWRTLVSDPSQYGLEFSKVGYLSKDGTSIAAWLIPASAGARPNGSVILAHGAGGNRSKMLPRAAFLARNGWNVLAVDLRAHGESGGNYMSLGLFEAEDIIGGAEYLAQHGSTHPIVALGHSQGAVASLHAASQSDLIDAVVSDSAFVSQADLLQRVQTTMLKDKDTSMAMKFGMTMIRFPLVEQSTELFFYLRTHLWLSPRDPKVSALTSARGLHGKPALFLAGERDEIAPVENAKQIYEAAETRLKELVVLPGVDHSTYGKGNQLYENKTLEFLNKIASTMPAFNVETSSVNTQ